MYEIAPARRGARLFSKKVRGSVPADRAEHRHRTRHARPPTDLETPSRQTTVPANARGIGGTLAAPNNRCSGTDIRRSVSALPYEAGDKAPRAEVDFRPASIAETARAERGPSLRPQDRRQGRGREMGREWHRRRRE